MWSRGQRAAGFDYFELKRIISSPWFEQRTAAVCSASDQKMEGKGGRPR